MGDNSKGQGRAADLLKQNRESLEAIAAKLLEKESIAGGEFMPLLGQEKGV